jgi:streptogramin lyase
VLHYIQTKIAAVRLRSWAILPVLACLLVLSVAAAPAQAASFGKVGEFGEAGTAGGQFSSAVEESPRGIAVDPSGDLWVVDGGNARVQKLEPAGSSANFLLTFGWGVNGASEFQVCTSSCQQGLFGSEPGQFGVKLEFGIPFDAASGVAVEPGAAHDVYVTDTFNKRVEKFGPSGAYSLEFNGHETPAEELAYPWAVTVDSSGHVYVMDAGHQVVDRFSSTGTYQCQITGQTPGSPTECNGETAGSATPQGGFNFSTEASRSGANLAVDSSGDLYVADTQNSVIDEFGPSGEHLKQFTLGEGGRAIAVDSSGDVFAARAYGREIVEFDPAVSLTTPVAEFGSGTFGKAAGIATSGSGTSERVYVTDREFHKVWIFGPVITPECTTESAEGETATGATLTGTVNPLGLLAEYQFKYGTTTGYGGETPLEPAGEGTSGAKHSKAVSGLQPHQEYHYELVATNTNGSSPCGDKTLKTLSEAPLVSSEEAVASAITETGAKVEAQVNPNNEATHWHVEYSTSPSLSGATSVPSPEEEIAAGYGNVPISQPLSALVANTTYYWRAVASNTGGGLRQGTIESFLTLPATPTTGGASEVAQSTATVAGSFNPGEHDTHWYFEYGTAACGPTSCGERTTEEDGGAGTSPVEPKGALTKLQPLTTYHYRLVVANSTGPAYGPEQEVTTLPQAPAAITDPPISVTASSAILAGEVVPQCVKGRYPPSTYRFEYGTTIAYAAGSEEAAIAASSCATGGEAVTASLLGLLPNTVYHYRLDATSSGGETQGEDRTFTTNAAGQPGSTLPPGFSLTGTAPGGPTALVYPNLTGFTPMPPPPAKTTITSKALTKAQKLAKALKQCKKDRSKAKRAKCAREAKKKYGPAKNVKSKK